MKLIVIFGPQAVGKTTVGRELEKITGYKLFHNHMTMDLVAPFFYYETDTFRRLVRSFRFQMFRAFAKSNLPGIIFTYALAFNTKSDFEFIEKVASIFEKEGGKVYFVELEASTKTRLRRNKTSLRLCLKPNKKDLKASKRSLLDFDRKYVLNTDEKHHFPFRNFIKINNEKISARAAAAIVKKKFKLEK